VYEGAETLIAYITALETVFRPASEQHLARQAFNDRVQGVKESIQIYSASKRALFDLAHPEGLQRTLINAFTEGIINENVSRIVTAMEPLDEGFATFEQAVNAAQNAVAHERRLAKKGRVVNPVGLGTTLQLVDDLERLSNAAPTMSGAPDVPFVQNRGQCAPPQQHALPPPAEEPMDVGQLSMIQAHELIQYDPEAATEMLSEAINAVGAGQVRCWVCNLFGHFARDCYLRSGRGRGRGRSYTRPYTRGRRPGGGYSRRPGQSWSGRGSSYGQGPSQGWSGEPRVIQGMDGEYAEEEEVNDDTLKAIENVENEDPTSA
jgi:hypothetical protein